MAKTTLSQDDRWGIMAQTVLEHVRQTKRAPTHDVDAYMVTWFYTQRKLYEQGKMDESRAKTFAKIVRVLPDDKLDSRFKKRLSEFKRLVSRIGTGYIKATDARYNNIGQWAASIRYRDRKGTLSEDVKEQLQDAGFEFTVR